MEKKKYKSAQEIFEEGMPDICLVQEYGKDDPATIKNYEEAMNLLYAELERLGCR